MSGSSCPINSKSIAHMLPLDPLKGSGDAHTGTGGRTGQAVTNHSTTTTCSRSASLQHAHRTTHGRHTTHNGTASSATQRLTSVRLMESAPHSSPCFRVPSMKLLWRGAAHACQLSAPSAGRMHLGHGSREEPSLPTGIKLGPANKQPHAAHGPLQCTAHRRPTAAGVRHDAPLYIGAASNHRNLRRNTQRNDRRRAVA